MHVKDACIAALWLLKSLKISTAIADNSIVSLKSFCVTLFILPVTLIHIHSSPKRLHAKIKQHLKLIWIIF